MSEVGVLGFSSVVLPPQIGKNIVRSEQIGRTAYEIPSISAKWQLPEIATLTGGRRTDFFPRFS
jgi:hypothetical protein